MFSCMFCQIEIVDGTTDSNKCSKDHPHPLKIYKHCCNCYKEKTGWTDSDKHACLQCKTRAAQKADRTAEFDAAVAKAVAKAPAAKPAAAKASAAKKKRQREEAWKLDRAGGG